MTSEKKYVNVKDRAFNVWLDLVDELLEKKIQIAYAMFHAGERLQVKQQEHNNQLFLRADLWVATQEINLLLRRLPEFTNRKAGWSKNKFIGGTDM